jgi:carbonic anhydrase
MKKFLIIMCVFAVLSSGCATLPSHTSHWGYSGNLGPENWASLSADNFSCAGKNQSPINLGGLVEAELMPIEFNYQAGGHEILNNGHTVQVNYSKGSSIVVDEIQFELLQFHFHAPSENHIQGRSFPLEAHLVHADENGNLAVVAIMFNEGEANSGLATGWLVLPKHAGDNHTLTTQIDITDLLPDDRGHYRFNGSLTTPPCSEGVRWLVVKEHMTASIQQIEAFKQVLHEPNNRPLQAVNSRTILK